MEQDSRKSCDSRLRSVCVTCDIVLLQLTCSRSNAFTAAYDWRLSCEKLELRDHYFTRLKAHIETGTRTSGEKVVLISHSMGSQVLYYFLHWVEAAR